MPNQIYDSVLSIFFLIDLRVKAKSEKQKLLRFLDKVFMNSLESKHRFNTSKIEHINFAVKDYIHPCEPLLKLASG